jgi:hypothetical protein
MTAILAQRNGYHPDDPGPAEPPPDDRQGDLFDQRDILRHVRDFARSRRVCPSSVLGVVLVRASCQIPPHVVLPALVGGYASLNMSAALVGPPAGGKGGSEAAARDAVTFDGDGAIDDIPEFPIGSGEGIARTFTENGAETVHTAILSTPEVDTLAALFGRQGATLEGELRKVWMGEQLGFTNAQQKTRTNVPRLSYRAGLIVGVQPLRAGALLRGADGGTPQRFVWMPVLDADMPEQRPPDVTPRAVTLKKWAAPSTGQQFVVLDVPEAARADIDAHQVALHCGDPSVDPLGGHALLSRLKIAAALMVLDARQTVSDEDWKLAGRIMAVSDSTRAYVQRTIADRDRRDRTARALADAEHDGIVADSKVSRCKRAILKRLAKIGDGEQISHSELRRDLTSEQRDYFGAAIAELIDEGRATKAESNRGVAYGPPPRHLCHPAVTSANEGGGTGGGVPPQAIPARDPAKQGGA